MTFLTMPPTGATIRRLQRFQACSIFCRSFSVNMSEVDKFSAMSKIWWDPKKNPLIKMNPTRIARIRQVVQNHILSKRNDGLSDYPGKIFTGLKALDVGCGGGLLSESLARLGADVTAVDPSSEIVRMAKQHSQRDEEIAHKINYRGGSSVEQLASEILDQHGKARNSDLFDIVCVLEVIEHSSDPASLLSGASSLLKRPTDTCPGGILFVSTINKTAKSFAFAILGAEYITGMLPVGTHSWNQFFSPNDVSNLVRDQGLSEIDVCGMVLRPGFQLDFQLDENDTDVNWIAAYARK